MPVFEGACGPTNSNNLILYNCAVERKGVMIIWKITERKQKQENSVKEIPDGEPGRNVCRYLCRRRGFGTDRRDFREKIGIKTLERRPAMQNVK